MRRNKTARKIINEQSRHDIKLELDVRCQKLIERTLLAGFPDSAVLGEEGVAGEGNSALRWVVDPIDGTSNYMRDGRRFCVSLACLEDRTPLIGVVVAPALGETYVARQGGGALLNGTPIRAAETVSLDQAVIEVGWSHRRPNHDFLALSEKLLAQGARLRLGGSGTLGLAEVAAGRTDAYVELHINLWDVAAALVLLAESGAAVSPFLEGTGPTAGNPILACAPGVAGALSALTGLTAL